MCRCSHNIKTQFHKGQLERERELTVLQGWENLGHLIPLNSQFPELSALDVVMRSARHWWDSALCSTDLAHNQVHCRQS